MTFQGVTAPQAPLLFRYHKSKYGFLFSVREFRILWNDVGRNTARGSSGGDHCPELTSKPFVSWCRWLGFVPRESSGDQLRGPCPIHGSSSPKSRSFSANVGRNAYRCFKCDSSGNQLDLWAAVTKMDLHAAAIDLCEKAQVDIPWIRKW